MTPLTSSALDDAFAFAMSKHHNQVRKGTTIPYISHLMQVSGLVLENGGDADEAIAGLLHDVIEDQDVSPAEIEQLGVSREYLRRLVESGEVERVSHGLYRESNVIRPYLEAVQ